jgi:hypothetical protein
MSIEKCGLKWDSAGVLEFRRQKGRCPVWEIGTRMKKGNFERMVVIKPYLIDFDGAVEAGISNGGEFDLHIIAEG